MLLEQASSPTMQTPAMAGLNILPEPYLLRKTSTTRLTLPTAVDRYWVTATFACLSTLLVYIFPSSLLDTFSFHK